MSLTLATKKAGFERIRHLVDAVSDLYGQMHADHTVVLVREDYAYAADSSSDTPLKEFGGILDWVMHVRHNAVIHRLGVSSVKKFLFGKGTAKKQEMMREAYKRFRFEGDEHQTDAFAIALLARSAVLGEVPPELPAASKEAVLSLQQKDHALTRLSL